MGDTEEALKRTDQLIARNMELMRLFNIIDRDCKKMRGELDKLITTESSNEIEINSLKSEIKRLEKLLESKKGKSV